MFRRFTLLVVLFVAGVCLADDFMGLPIDDRAKKDERPLPSFLFGGGASLDYYLKTFDGSVGVDAEYRLHKNHSLGIFGTVPFAAEFLEAGIDWHWYFLGSLMRSGHDDFLKFAVSGFYLDQHSDRTMIFVHGYRGEPVSNFCMQAKHYCELGWNLLFIIQRAHGDSGGKYLGLGVLERHDIPVWIDFAAQKQGVESIVLSGSSMGSTSIAYASDTITEKKVKALVLDCGFVAPRNQLEHDARIRRLPYFLILPVMRAYGRLCIKEDIYLRTTDSLKNCRIPTVFIHGTGDKTVSLAQGLENYEACAAPKLWIPVEGAQHILAYTVGGKDTEIKTERFLMQYITRERK